MVLIAIVTTALLTAACTFLLCRSYHRTQQSVLRSQCADLSATIEARRAAAARQVLDAQQELTATRDELRRLQRICDLHEQVPSTPRRSEPTRAVTSQGPIISGVSGFADTQLEHKGMQPGA